MSILALIAALVDQPRRFVDRQPSTFDGERHVREHELNCLVLRNHRPEGLALAGVLHRVVHGTFSKAEGSRADYRPDAVQAEHGVVEALALDAADEVLDGHAYVLEGEV